MLAPEVVGVNAVLSWRVYGRDEAVGSYAPMENRGGEEEVGGDCRCGRCIFGKAA
jgi:hypothetical protein